MSRKALVMFVIGVVMLGLAACSAQDAPPVPVDPTTFFSTVVPVQGAEAALLTTPTAAPVDPVARPSNPGGPGLAATLKGDAAAGQTIFSDNCVRCHGLQGKGGVPNPGSDDGTVPSLNPIDPTLISQDYATFATNLDLFLEHGSTPSGSSPVLSMPNWGDSGKLKPQQIADVIAYVISLNK